ncbi:DHA2 family efflux MFS transporter permease subunit [Tessaracoccus aquimaris]|uniref:DHA2 family efflux MFS transporter permease subunit n=1 Tax=Tessaracoccus aquimaris TaxID=1332264 RepID=UPI001D04F8B2|nr:DHA2 family efflux MFS transporter permease subunit [Tessaracoccus aquimaris]
MDDSRSPWPGFLSMIIGFFMILVDSTIVTIAMPHIMRSFDTGINNVIWVTSAYLLAYAVPLLITGRLGDRFGPKPIFLLGLFIFTASSLWCGLAGSIGMLILARVVQGLGAALMAPQTMAVIMRTFPVERRGAPMGLWGSVAGIAMLVGPLLGGFLVDAAGWEWIFFINVPVGIAAMVLVAVNVPRLETHSHSFDLVGVALSAVGLFLIVFGIQEGETYAWGNMPVIVFGATLQVPIFGMIAVGVVAMGVFIWWQRVTRSEPLVPLQLFADRNYVLSNTAISVMGLVAAASNIPLFLYVQSARGFTPSQSAVLMIPMAVASGLLSPFIGRFLQDRDPRPWIAGGLVGLAAAMAWYGLWLDPSRSPWWLLLPSLLVGVSSSFIWGPLALVATRNLPRDLAGAGSGVYNTTRQIGSVLGSAAIAAVMSARLTAELGPGAAAQGEGSSGAAMPPQVVEGFSAAMGQSMFLPAGLLLLAVVSVAFMRPPGRA